MQADLEASDLAELERQKVKEERAFGLRGERDHLAATASLGLIEDPLQVRRLAALAG